MPELPEVETIRRSLAPKVVGQRILQTELLLERLVKWPEPADFQGRLADRTIARIERTGKYLRFGLDNGTELIVHLRMTGQLRFVAAGAAEVPYARIVFRFAGGASLYYADARTLGAVYALKPDELWRLHGLTEMGPEPLTAAFSLEYLQRVLQGRRTKIKSFLLNQKYIGGIGNIYADEALFLAGIHPLRTADSLAAAEIRRLHEAINAVILAGIEDGGTTVRNYRDGEGKKGSHQDRLHVYQRTGEPCHHCGTAIERIVVGGRGSHFCPHCQPFEGESV